MNNVDRIFNETLEGYSSTPPTAAWERVEMTLSRRPAASPLRWAAILVPLVIAAGWMLSRNEQPDAQVATENSSTPAASAPVTAVQEVKAFSEPVAIRRKSRQAVNVVSQATVASVEPFTSHPENARMEEITVEPVELIAEAAEPLPTPTAEKPLVIVITLDAVVETPDVDKKPLTRVAEFAMAVKHSDPIASLRGVKDELLALDLRKKSTKKN